MRERIEVWYSALKSLDRLTKSKSGQMPFSLVAVLLLVFSSASVVLISGMNSRIGDDHPSSESLGEMKEAIDSAVLQIEQAALSIAVDVIGEIRDLNESEMNRRFNSSLNEFIKDRYPILIGRHLIDINETSVSLSFLRMTMDELYPEFVGGPSGAFGWNRTTVPAYFSIYGTCKVSARGEDGFLVREREISEAIYLPFPFLTNRLQSFSDSVAGGRSEFENTVRYELSALAQDRVLRGYGIGSRDGSLGTATVLTEQDVVDAFNLALLLEQRKHFRAIDQSALDSLAQDTNLPGSLRIADLLSDRNISGTLDPAELFLGLYGSEGYDTRLILAESLYAVADQLVLKWLEFFHLIDAAEFVEQAADLSNFALSYIVEAMLGVDSLQDSVLGWIRERLAAAGFQEAYYRYMNYGSPDALIEIPAHRMVFFNDANESFPLVLVGPRYVDFKPYDLFATDAWKWFYSQYKIATCEFAETLDNFIKSIAQGIAFKTNLPIVSSSFDPFDHTGYAENLRETIGDAILDRESWMETALHYATESTLIVDQMGEAFLRFIDSYWQELFERNSTVEEAIHAFAEGVVHEFSSQLSGFGPESVRIAVNRVYWEAMSSNWGLKEEILGAFDARVDLRLDAFKAAFGNSPSDDRGGWLGETLSGIVYGTVGGFPEFEQLMSGMALRLIEDTCNSFAVRADPVFLPFPRLGEFTLHSEDGWTILEGLGVESETNGSGPTLHIGNDLRVNIVEPWEYSPNEQYPNRHITDLDNFTFRPFTTQWHVSLSGSLNAVLKAKAIASGLFGDLASASTTVPFDMSFTISAQSGWPLKGVRYESTSTLLKEVSRFLEGIWSQVCGGIGFIAGGISKAFSFLQTMFSTLLSYAVKVVEFLANVLQTMVSAVQDFFFKGATTVVGWIAEGVSALLGTVRFNLTIFGLSFSVQTNVADLALGSTKDILRITFSLCALGATLSISARILRLGAGYYDILANATLSTDAWTVSVVIDPLMRVFRHFVEIRGVFGNRAFELNVPEVVQYERLRLSLSEVPGIGAFLSSIPMPFPGLVGSVDAGFELKYNLPFTNHLVINEYERNPPGSDYGREWIEIYNPTETAQSLAGWTIETSHGAQRLEALGDRSIQPRSHAVFVMEGQALDNGGEVKFPLMECIVLRNPSGERVDSTPWTTDYYNDGRTWQRVSDGADRWAFKEETAGRYNGKRASGNTDFDWMRKAVLDAAASAFGEISDVTVNMDALGRLVKRAVEKLVENCIEALADSIVELRVYVEVAVKDYSSSARAGFAISLVATGEFVEKAIKHLIRMVADAIGNMINPCHAGEETNAAESALEDVYVRFGAFGEIGLPRMISRAVEGTSVRFDALVEANLPAVASLMGKELGSWRVTFGLCISEVPGSILPTVFGVGTDKLADVWIFRASVFET